MIDFSLSEGICVIMYYQYLVVVCLLEPTLAVCIGSCEKVLLSKEQQKPFKEGIEQQREAIAKLDKVMDCTKIKEEDLDDFLKQLKPEIASLQPEEESLDPLGDDVKEKVLKFLEDFKTDVDKLDDCEGFWQFLKGMPDRMEDFFKDACLLD